jgi:glutaminyl-tRNA synthetase
VETNAAAPASAPGSPGPSLDFIRALVAEDVRQGKHGGQVVTRFPPEPNGYLHIGHAKALCLSFGVAAEFGGRCHLRFDDTNPETEDIHYVESIIDVVRWLGFDWGEHLYFASDYFERMYEFARHLIHEGKAYVDGSTEEEIREARGTVTEPGRPTRFRGQTVEESLDLFARMRAGEFPNGAYVLRARIDLASPNMLMRDPILYRIRHAEHYRTGGDWCIYPLYDYAHPIEDALECVTHSLCTLEFENNREFYDWVVDSLPVEGCRPRQYEFARLVLDYTVMSKRKLLQLVREGLVSGWDDPRMPTLAAYRRRGVTPEAIRAFAEMVGVARANSRVDLGKLEFAIREDLNMRVPRVLCVLRPLKVVLTNYPEGASEMLDAPYYPHDVPLEGSRPLPFGRELFIDRDDFAEDPPKGWHRMAPGREVRLRYGYVVTCDEVVRDGAGEVVELRCTYDPATRGGTTPDGRQVKGTIHWVSAAHALPCEVRLYDRLFTVPDPDAGDDDFKRFLNPESLVVVTGARVEPSVRDDPAGSRYQFERTGYFCSDAVDSRPDALVFNRTVTLRDTYGKSVAPAAQPDLSAAARRKAEAKAAPPSAPQARSEVARSPELEARRARYRDAHALGGEDADLLTRDDATADLFEAVVAAGAAPKPAANWVVQELPRAAAEAGEGAVAPTGVALAGLVALVEEGAVSTAAAREVLAEMLRTGDAAAAIVDRRGLRQVSDRGALVPAVEEVLAAHAAKADEYRGGKTGLLGFFVGQVMRATGGKANPEVVGALLRSRLDG